MFSDNKSLMLLHVKDWRLSGDLKNTSGNWMRQCFMLSRGECPSLRIVWVLYSAVLQ